MDGVKIESSAVTVEAMAVGEDDGEDDGKDDGKDDGEDENDGGGAEVVHNAHAVALLQAAI